MNGIPKLIIHLMLGCFIQASDGVDHKALESALLDNPAGTPDAFYFHLFATSIRPS